MDLTLTLVFDNHWWSENCRRKSVNRVSYLHATRIITRPEAICGNMFTAMSFLFSLLELKVTSHPPNYQCIRIVSIFFSLCYLPCKIGLLFYFWESFSAILCTRIELLPSPLGHLYVLMALFFGEAIWVPIHVRSRFMRSHAFLFGWGSSLTPSPPLSEHTHSYPYSSPSVLPA